MAVDFGKLNKAGLGATTFGARKTTGTSAQAAKNLQNSTAATKSTLFSFKRSPRTNWVPGQHVTKGQSQYNYQGMRASLNGAAGARRTYAPSFTGPVGNFGMPNVQVNNDMAKGMMVGQTIVAGMSLLNQLGGIIGGGDGVKSSSLGDKLSNVLGSLSSGNSSLAGVTSAEVSAAISGMNSASDSVALRSAISSAESELASLNAKISADSNTAETKETEEKADKDKADKDYNTKKQEATKVDQKVASQTKVVEARKLEVSNAQKDVDQAEARVDSAIVDVNNAESNVSVKESNLASAKAELASTPKTKPGPNNTQVPNQPALRIAEQKVKDAENEKVKAQKELERAKDKLRDAESAKDSADTRLSNANTNLEKAEGDLTKAKEEQTKLTKELGTARETKDKEQTEYDAAKAENDKVKEMKADAEALKTAITEQKERLADLEKAEQKEYASLDKKIGKDIDKNAKDIGKINYDDGLNKKEQRKSDKIGERNDRISANETKRDGLEDNVDLTFVMKQSPSFTDISGSYRTGTNPLTGNTVYARDGQLITEEEYNAALKAGGANL